MTASSPPLLLVFTDLDGSLLDARTYGAEPARGALAALAARGVPVVFCSSKTAAEQRARRAELGLPPAPYIVENGAALFVPDACRLPADGWPRAADVAGERVRVLGRTRAEVRAGLGRAEFASGVRATGYGDLTLEEVARRTGLRREAAARAVCREYSETLVDAFRPDDWARLERALRAEGLSGRHGGRFRTVAGIETDKGHAVRAVTELFRAASGGGAVTTAGLGDSANDEGLLLAVDRAYLLPQDTGRWAPLEIPGLRRVARPGPEGWQDAVTELLAEGAGPATGAEGRDGAAAR